MRYAKEASCKVVFVNYRLAFVGIPEAASGKCEITLGAENENPDYRARLTVITLGEILQ